MGDGDFMRVPSPFSNPGFLLIIHPHEQTGAAFNCPQNRFDSLLFANNAHYLATTVRPTHEWTQHQTGGGVAL